MKNFTNQYRKIYLSLALGIAVVGVVGAESAVAQQGRDPFSKPVVVAPRGKGGTAKIGGTAVKTKPIKPPVVAISAPSIEQRINNYKLLRQRALETGVAPPKPTSALTIDELDITGIFHTPRGYAAMVQAKPLQLSYTIYPGEEFFNGQLVAIEESRLVFRRVTQMSDNKIVTTAENKGLMLPTLNEMIVPRVETATNAAPGTVNPAATATQTTVNPTATVTVAPENPVLTADNKPEESAAMTDEKPKTNKRQPKRVEPRGKSKPAKTSSPRIQSGNTVDNNRPF